LKAFGVLSPAGWRAVIRMASALVAALLVGLIIGRVWLVLALVTGVALAHQLWNLLRVEHWLRRRSVEAPPDISGAWGELVAIISRLHRRKQHHKAQVTGLLREFRRLTSAMPEGAVLLGPEHQILWLNPRAAAWLGLRRKRDFGIRIENLVRQPAFIEYLRTGRPESGVVVQDTGDLSRWFSFHLVAGVGERQLLIVRDVSREQHLEHMRKDFVANASHELRSPLTVIAGYLDALAEDQKLDPTWSTPVLEMRRQADRMGTIINDLLELSRLESGVRSQEERAVDIAGLLSVLRKEALATEPHGRVVNLKIESDAMLLGVESELHSIAANLVSNAVKYTPATGEIELRWWTDQEGAYISVRDSGIGIPPEHVPRLTERFYRVDPGRARSMGGSGLGLSIVKHALQRHDGVLQIESREGVGSTFTCIFPVDRIIAREAHAAAV
jgi:two-component system, OmpR family, phosphate regulon sensor histidine kinase PhoR